jgi:hypothetical protein
MKQIAILQSSYFPWLGYFDQLIKSDVFIIYDDVQFDKNGWRNRNKIRTSNGEMWLTVPIHNKLSSKIHIKDIQIDYSKNWTRKHLNSIYINYSKANYFNDYFPHLKLIFEKNYENLVDLNMEILKYINNWLGVNRLIIKSSTLGIQGSQTERLINICKYFGLYRYLTGNSAINYLELEKFKSAGIEVIWQNYEHPKYTQVYKDFIPYLSILDLIMNEGKNSLEIISGSK